MTMAKRKAADATRAEATEKATLDVQPTQPTQMKVEQIAIDDIADDAANPRLRSGDIAGLASSMAQVGLLQPIRVIPVGEPDNPRQMAVVSGHRRLAAARLLGWKTIPATIAMLDENVHVERAVENLQREEPDAIETSMHVGNVFDDEWANACATAGVSPDAELQGDVARLIRDEAIKATANRLGKPVTWVRDQHFLSLLDATTRGLVIDGRLPMQHARELVKIADPATRAELAKAASVFKAEDWRPRRRSPRRRIAVGTCSGSRCW